MYSSPSLFNHCARSYLWAASLGRSEGLDFDAELLYVAALLHDLGLVEAFDTHRTAFEEAGGDVGWVLAAGAGWPEPRRERVKEIVVRHMWDAVDPRDGCRGLSAPRRDQPRHQRPARRGVERRAAGRGAARPPAAEPARRVPGGLRGSGRAASRAARPPRRSRPGSPGASRGTRWTGPPDQARISRASNSIGRSIVLPTGDVLTTCSCSACSAASSASLSTRAVASIRS